MNREITGEPGPIAVFLDRDGTLIEEVDYLERVARGYFTESVVPDVHRHIDSLLASGGARIDAYYYCPHHPAGAVVRTGFGSIAKRRPSDVTADAIADNLVDAANWILGRTPAGKLEPNRSQTSQPR